MVAVIDSGVNYNHEDLVNQMWNGQNCVDQNGNSLGGCIHGYDFDQNDKNPLPDTSDHGTHVAGIIAAQSNNGKGITGVAPKTKIMAIKGFSTTAKAVDAIHFAKQNGAKIINASWGGYFLAYEDCSDINATPTLDMALYNAISDFGDAGGLFITAAGNDNYNHDVAQTRSFPAGFGTDFQCGNQSVSGLDNIISVAATDSNDIKASFSDYGKNSVHIAAPGVDIKSTSEVTTYDTDYETLVYDSFFSYPIGNSILPSWIENSGSGSIGIADTFGSK